MADSLDQDESDFIELAHGPRKVATPAGAEFYGLPIGSPITKDVRDAVNAAKGAKGLTPPKGALSSGNKGSNAGQAGLGAAHIAAKENAPAIPAGAPNFNLKVAKSSISGPSKFSVGETAFEAPKGSKLIQPKDAEGMAYVVTPDGTVHAFVEKGEVPIPDILQKKLQEKFSGDLTNDPHYDEVPFGAEAATSGISNLKPGDQLEDKEGTPQFTKQEDGTFKHNVLGATLTEKDLSSDYEKGDLVPSKTKIAEANAKVFDDSKANDFKSMTHQEATAALDRLDEGTQIDAHGVIYTKKSGSWESETGLLVASSSMAQVRNSMKIVGTKDEPHKPTDENAPDEEKPNVPEPEAEPKPDAPKPPSNDDKQTAAPADEGESADSPKVEVPASADEKNAPVEDAPKAEKPAVDKNEGIEHGDDVSGKLTALKPGSVVRHHRPIVSGEGGVLKDSFHTKQEDGKWAQLNTGTSVKQSVLEDKLYTTKSNKHPGKFYLHSHPGEDIEQDADKAFTPKTPEPQKGMYDKPKADVPEVSVPKEKTPDEPTLDQVSEELLTPEPDAPDVPKGSTVVTDFNDIKPNSALLYDTPENGLQELKKNPFSDHWNTSAGLEDMSDYQLQSSIANGHVFFAPDQPKDEPKPDKKKFSVGDKIQSVQDLHDAEAGTVMTYAKKDGTETKYTKTDDGKVLTQWGNTYDPEALAGSAKSGKFTIQSVPSQDALVTDTPEIVAPDVPETKAPHDYKPEDKITKFGHLRDMAPGTTLHNSGTGPTNGFELTKQDDGSWEDTSHGTGLMDFQELGEELSKGHLYYGKSPDVQHPVTDDKHHTLEAGGTAFSTKDLKDAVDALESHPSSQVAYGLKSVKDGAFGETDHKDEQNKLVDRAKKTYPDLKPKPAVIKLLKNKLGLVHEEKAEEHTVVDSGPKIHFGDKEPKTNNFGASGGDFSASEVEDAIKIMEAFQGKNYLADLKNKGNNVGYLNDNALVGFDKDKTVKKQKMIDLLKQKLDIHNSSNAPAPEEPKVEEPEATPEVPEAKPELDLTPKAAVDLDRLDEYPDGTQIGIEDSPTVLTKKGSVWVTQDGDSVFKSDNLNGTGKWNNYFIHQDEPAPTPEDFSTPLEDLPAAEPVELKPEVPSPEEKHVQIGDELDPLTMDTLPQGSKVTSKFGITYTKQSSGNWNPDNPGLTTEYSSSTFEKAQPKVAYLPERVEVDQNLTAQNLKDVPIGATIQSFYEGTPGGVMTKTGPDEFSGTGAPVDNDLIQTLMKSGVPFKMTSHPSSVPGYATTPAAVQDKNGPDEATVNFNGTDLVPGKYTANGPSYLIAKADGTGVYVTADGKAHAITTQQVLNNYNSGMKNYQGMPDTIPEITPVEAAKVKPKAPKKSKVGDVTLENGIYFAGGSGKAGSKVYEVKDGQVKIHEGQYNQQNYPELTDWVPLNKLKVAYNKGAILDADGNSVVPDGYEGALYVNKVPTSSSALLVVKKKLDAGEYTSFFNYEQSGAIAKDGFQINQGQMKQAIWAAHPDDPNLSGYPYGLQYEEKPDDPFNIAANQYLKDTIYPLVDKMDIKEPEENAASDKFDWGQNDTVQKPDFVTLIPQNSSAANTNPYIKQIQNHFGGSDVMIPVTLSPNEKYNWISYLKKGNFAAMYQIEVNAANNKKKSHAKGYLHPGYPGNPATNHVNWGPAVAGEVPATTEVPGSWSDIEPTSWSSPEIGNYLISAHMMYPEHLTNTERRAWVRYHKGSKNQEQVDILSIRARDRANNGDAPLNSEPVWTENIKPAKLYDVAFDDTEYPLSSEWGNAPFGSASSYLKDHIKDDPELKQSFIDAVTEMGYSQNYIDAALDAEDYTNSMATAAVVQHFTKKKQAYDDEQAKPRFKVIYKKKGKFESGADPDAGTHPTYFLTDQHGAEYVFKPSDVGKEWRTEQEVAAGELARKLGFNTPKSSVHSFTDGYFDPNGFDLDTGVHGILMDKVNIKSNLENFDLTTLTPQQAAQIASEHVGDWFLDNDDTHAQNMLMDLDGNIVGIDKGRSFFIFGHWNGLDLSTGGGEQGPNWNAHQVSQDLYDKMMTGGLSQEHIDTAYLAAMKAAKKVQKADPQVVEDYIREGAKNRDSFKKPHYYDPAKPAPENLDELIADVLARKETMPEQIDAMWSKIYAKAGFEKPEPPKKIISEEHMSGWEEDDLLPAVADGKVLGVSTLHAGAGIEQGSSLLWTSMDTDGAPLTSGQFQTGSITQKKIVEFLQTKVGSTGSDPVAIENFPNLDAWKSLISHAGKDISNNQIDKEYNEEIQKEFQDVADKVYDDLKFWQDTQNGDGFPLDEATAFPSGNSVPAGASLQYKQSLDHYQGLVDKVQAVKDNGGATSKYDFSTFTPVAAAQMPETYTHSDGSSYTQLATKNFLHYDAATGTVTQEHSIPGEVQTSDEWTKKEFDGKSDDPVDYSLGTAGSHSGELSDDGTLSLDGGFQAGYSYGNPGDQYTIKLPTGETIRFRNAGTTNTAWSQRGRVNFTLDKNSDQAASLARVQDYLEKNFGLDLNGADEETAQTVYWRSMFNRLVNSVGGNKEEQATRKELMDMLPGFKKDFPGQIIDNHTVVEAISLTKTPAEEAAFWDALARKTYGDSKVTEWINEGGHLPHYKHMDLSDTDKKTGKSFFKRIDTDDKALLKNGTFIAIGNKGKDDSNLRYFSTGGMLSTEERLRQLGTFKEGLSSGDDQGTGGANAVFTRVAKGSAYLEGSGGFGAHVAYWNPTALNSTKTYSYTGDRFGRLSALLESGNDVDLLEALKHGNVDNEALVADSLSIFDHLEVMVFKDAMKRDQAIQLMKQKGLAILRGIPIEERFIFRADLQKALDKAKKQWDTEYDL